MSPAARMSMHKADGINFCHWRCCKLYLNTCCLQILHVSGTTDITHRTVEV